MIEFNKISTTSNLIKNLLNNTYLPLIKTVREGDYIVVNRLYIYKCNVIKCTESGYIASESSRVYNKITDVARFDYISEYTFGDKNNKLCTKFLSNNAGYDYVTHERLGNYLRCLRDMYGLNLMPLYNCFSANVFPGHYISNDRVTKTLENHGTKIYKVPIRFNKDYTICMDNYGSTRFAPAFIKYDNLLKVNNTSFGNKTDVTNKYIRLRDFMNIQTESDLRFKNPIKIRINNIPEDIVRYKYKTVDNIVDADSKPKLDFNIVKLKVDDANKYFRIINTRQLTIITDVNEVLNTKNLIDQFFIPVELKTKNQYDKLIAEGYTFYKIDSTNKEKSNLILATDIVISSTAISEGTYYISRTNPAVNGWYELVTSNDTIDINSQSDMPTLSTDTIIQTDDKTYLEEIRKELQTSKTYSITEELCQLYDSIEKNLYLLIQVPEEYDSNIVVIEGDYTQNNSMTWERNENNKLLTYNTPKETAGDIYRLDNKTLDYLYTDNLSLMAMTSTKQIPFSPRLIEFLLWNAICNLDEINNDLDRLAIIVKKKIDGNLGHGQYMNYWTPEFRKAINEYILNYQKNFTFDNLGYVTRDIEKVLEKG